MTAVAAVAFGVDIPGLRLNEAFAQSGAVDLGAGDVGVLNYAYALEQLVGGFLHAGPRDALWWHERV